MIWFFFCTCSHFVLRLERSLQGKKLKKVKQQVAARREKLEKKLGRKLVITTRLRDQISSSFRCVTCESL